MPYLLMFLFFLPTAVSGKDFGTFSETFPIVEEDFIIVLQERLKSAQQTDSQRKELQRAFVKTVEKPKGISLPQATKNRSFEYDPTICLQEDIKDEQGELIVAKGTKVNPLDTTALKSDLLFFDGNEQKQLLWAKGQTGLWILTKGEPLDLEKKEDRQVYFDQAGYLSKKLGIRSLPAKVSQKGKKLKIEEIPCF